MCVMPVLVLGIGKRVGECDGLSFCSTFEPCAKSFDDCRLAASLIESSSDDDVSADSANANEMRNCMFSGRQRANYRNSHNIALLTRDDCFDMVVRSSAAEHDVSQYFLEVRHRCCSHCNLWFDDGFPIDERVQNSIQVSPKWPANQFHLHFDAFVC